MDAHKTNHCEYVKSICVNYYDKCESDLEDLMKILTLLHHMLDSCETKITAMNNTTATLIATSESLDSQCQKIREMEDNIHTKHKDSTNAYAHTLVSECKMQAEKVSHIFILITDIVSLEEGVSNPFSTFKLHHCLVPHLLGSEAIML